MNLQQVLNADMSTIGRTLRLGLAWWGRELAESLPPALRRGGSRAAPWLAEMSQDGQVRLWRDGAPAPPVDFKAGSPRPADVLAPPGAVLVRDLDLPRLSATDLDRLVQLNLDRFTPFTAEQAYFDTLVLERPANAATQRVRLGVILRARGEALAAQAAACGLKVERLGAGAGPDGRTLQFDFMRSIRLAGEGDPGGRRRAYLWAACGVLAAANVGVAVLRDSNDVNQLQRLVDAQQPTVAMAMKLRRTVESERVRRIGLLTRRSAHEPLRIMDAATRALPANQWVQRLEWNGRAVRLVGFRKAEFDVLAALHGPALANPRSLLSDMPTKAPGGQTPFDVMADAASARRPK